MGVAVVKLGSSVITEDTGELRVGTLNRVCAQVAELHAAGVQPVIVTSGAIARGMRVLGLGGRPTQIAELQAASAVGQGALFREYDHRLAAAGIRTAQVLLTFYDMSARVNYLNARRTLRTLLDWGVVPVINENDTTTTDEISFGDNDFLAAQVAILLGAEVLVLLTDTPGLHTADPRHDPEARHIAEIHDPAELRELQIGHASSPLGSGGMRSKVVAAEMATAAGVATVIGAGHGATTVLDAVQGRPTGTLFHPQSTKVSSFKLWLRWAKPSLGRLLVDAGAARALREGGTSLLPVGVTAVHGDFDAGDAVDIVEADPPGTGGERVIGKGICSLSAGELRRVQGRKSAEVRDVLPMATDEVVHRDYLVLV